MKTHGSTAHAAQNATLPKALAERAKAQHVARMQRLAARAHDAIARIRERQTDIAANMVDIGLALAELKEDGMAQALGRSGFAEVCEKDLLMSPSTAAAFVTLATRMPRALVTSLGPDRARAVLELVDAVPDNDTPEHIARAKLPLPSGRTLDVAQASTQEIRDAARELRDVRPRTHRRGFTATADEKKRFKALARQLQDAGSPRLVASRGERGAKVRFEVHLAELEDFAALLRKACRG